MYKSSTIVISAKNVNTVTVIYYILYSLGESNIDKSTNAAKKNVRNEKQHKNR